MNIIRFFYIYNIVKEICTEQEKQEVWSPNIVFGNTESQEKVVIDRDVIAKIKQFNHMYLTST